MNREFLQSNAQACKGKSTTVVGVRRNNLKNKCNNNANFDRKVLQNREPKFLNQSAAQIQQVNVHTTHVKTRFLYNNANINLCKYKNQKPKKK